MSKHGLKINVSQTKAIWFNKRANNLWETIWIIWNGIPVNTVGVTKISFAFRRKCLNMCSMKVNNPFNDSEMKAWMTPTVST